MVAMLLPSTYATRQPALKVHCQSKLHQLGIEIGNYFHSHGGAFPDSFASLLRDQPTLTPLFSCPANADKPVQGARLEDVIKSWRTPGHLSYVYLGGGLAKKTALPTTVVAYDRLGNHGNRGVNVLFGDGRTAFENMAWVAKAGLK